MSDKIIITNGEDSYKIRKEYAIQSRYIKKLIKYNENFNDTIELKEIGNKQLSYIVKVLKRKIPVIDKKYEQYLSFYLIKYPKEITAPKKLIFLDNSKNFIGKYIKNSMPFRNYGNEYTFNFERKFDLYSKMKLYFDIPANQSKYSSFQCLEFIYNSCHEVIIDNVNTFKFMAKNGFIKIKRIFSYFIDGVLYYRYKMLLPLWFSRDKDYQKSFKKLSKKFYKETNTQEYEYSNFRHTEFSSQVRTKLLQKFLKKFLFLHEFPYVIFSINLTIQNAINIALISYSINVDEIIKNVLVYQTHDSCDIYINRYSTKTISVTDMDSFTVNIPINFSSLVPVDEEGKIIVFEKCTISEDCVNFSTGFVDIIQIPIYPIFFDDIKNKNYTVTFSFSKKITRNIFLLYSVREFYKASNGIFEKSIFFN